MTDAERWARVGALFDKAIESPPTARATIVETSLENDEVKAEVLSLLASHDEANDFLAPPPAPPPPAAPGAVLGPYRIIRVAGEGGMGIVYEAEDTRLHRMVALKLLPPALAGDDRQRERLKHEARAAAALSHPGIATVYALDEVDGQIAIATEFIDGESLRVEIDRGAMPIARAMASAVEITHALCVAHDRGIVHRDLKPENILRTREGTLKILDFGLAQFDGSARELVSMTLTEAGLVAGTPPYMAPEQLLGRGTDFRTDHFAFGVLLYELIAGRHPFGAHSLPSTIAKILAGEPQTPEHTDQFPPEVWAIIDRCLQKDPASRFQSTQDLTRAVEDAHATLAAQRSNAGTSTLGTQGTAGTSTPSTQGTAGTNTPGTLGTVGTRGTLSASALWWWRFHQVAAAAIYWAMIWPVWHIHRGIGRGGLFFFFATLAAVVVAANLRIHLWFSSRVYPEQLDEQRADTSRWIRLADGAFVALLVAGGLMLPDDRAGWAALLISVGIGTAVAFLIIEPSTARAAFGQPRHSR